MTMHRLSIDHAYQHGQVKKRELSQGDGKLLGNNREACKGRISIVIEFTRQQRREDLPSPFSKQLLKSPITTVH